MNNITIQAELDLLKPQIARNIRALDVKQVLDDKTIDNMTNSLSLFVFNAARKFITGQKEHGGKITDRDLQMEMYRETLDMFWYNAAQKWER